MQRRIQSNRRFRSVPAAVQLLEGRILLSAYGEFNSTAQPLLIQGTSGNDTIAVSVGTANALVVNLNGAVASYTAAQYAGGVSIDTGRATAQDTITIAGLPAVQTSVVSSDPLKATVGSAGRGLADVASTSLTVGGSAGTAQVTVEDSTDSIARHLTLNTAATGGVTYEVVHGLTPGDILVSASPLVINLGNAGNTITVNGTAPRPPAFSVVNLNTGNGADFVDTYATTAGTILNINGQNGPDSAFVGTHSSQGVVNVSNPLGKTSLSIGNDGPQSPDLRLDTFSAPQGTYGSLTGDGPGVINFNGANMESVSVNGAQIGINSLTVNNTPGGGLISLNTSAPLVLGVAANQWLDLWNVYPPGDGVATVDFTTGRIMPGSNITTHVRELDIICLASDPCTYDGLVEHNGATVGTDDLDIENINFHGPGSTATKVNISGNPFDPFVAYPFPGVNISGEAVITDTEYYLRNIYADLMTVARTPTPLTHFAEFGTWAGYGRLDITNNEAKFDQGNAADIRNQVRSGLAGGDGITSSLANSQFGIGITDQGTGFGGTAAVDVRYARWGDANLDGTVNFSDLLISAQNYGRTDVIWDHGDFNYDGKVDFADLLKLGQNYGKSLQAPAAAGASTGLQPLPSQVLKPRRTRRLSTRPATAN